MFPKVFIAFLAFVLPFISVLPSGAIEADPKEITITVSNVPVNQPSIFIPLSLSSDDLELYRAELKDIFVRGYIVSIEKNSDGKLLGISFADLRSKTLPESLVAVVKVRPKIVKEDKQKKLAAKETKVDSEEQEPQREQEKDSEAQEEKASSPQKPIKAKSRYPKNVVVSWDSPWAYTKPTKKLKSAFAGFNMIETGILDSNDLEQKNLKKKIEKEKSKNRDFYIKSLGQTLVRSKRGVQKNINDVEYTKPFLRELRFFTFIPEEVDSEKLYIPLLGDEANSIKIFSGDKGIVGNVLFRALSNNLIEISTIDPETKLPSNSLVSGLFVLEQNPNVLINKVLVGPVLTEPSETISGVSVVISPATVYVGNPFSNPAKAF